MNGRTVYISLLRGGASYTTVTALYTGSGMRNYLRDAIQQGKVTEPGTYAVASPDGGMLCMQTFEVERVPPSPPPPTLQIVEPGR